MAVITCSRCSCGRACSIATSWRPRKHRPSPCCRSVTSSRLAGARSWTVGGGRFTLSSRQSARHWRTKSSFSAPAGEPGPDTSCRSASISDSHPGCWRNWQLPTRRQRSHARNAARPLRSGGDPAGDLRASAAAVHPGCPRGGLQRRPAVRPVEHPPRVGKIPPHRSDAGSFLLAECFGCATLTLVKDVDGLYDRDPKEDPAATFIDEIEVADLVWRNLPTLPFDRVVLDLLTSARQITQFQVINGLKPELLEPALRGEHVGTIVRRDSKAP